MGQPKPNQLFKAANAGNVGRIAELLAAGVPVDVQDMERMTPLMRAAQNGQAAAFYALVKAGADLHAVGMVQIDVLEMAASGGNVEIVRFLIDKGLPLEGHWQPRSQAARREGHMTPLICAAIAGQGDVVRLLLQAGADRAAKFNGQTALKMVQGEIKFPVLPGRAERKDQFVAVAALLAETADAGAAAEDAAALAVASFAKYAVQPAYAQIRQLLTSRCGAGRPWQPLPDHGTPAAEVTRYTLRHCDQEQTITSLQDEVRQAGFSLIMSEPWLPGENAEFVLFPTSDKFAVVAAVGTEGDNYGLQTAEVIAWLRKLEKQNPFALRVCAHDLIGAEFLGSVKGAKKLAEEIVEFCPCCLDEGFETPQQLARALTKDKGFVLRWD